jgi:hypothetical protein
MERGVFTPEDPQQRGAEVDGAGRTIIEVPKQMRGREIGFIVEFVSEQLRSYEEMNPSGVIEVFRYGPIAYNEYAAEDLLTFFERQLSLLCNELSIQEGGELDRGTLREISKRLRQCFLGFAPRWFNIEFVREGEAWQSWAEEQWEHAVAQGGITLH